MPLTPNDITEFISAVNQSGNAIPLSITTVNATDPTQFNISVALTLISSAIIVFWMFEAFGKPYAASVYAKIALWRFRQKTGRNYIIIKHTASGLFEQSMIDGSTLQSVEKAVRSFKGKPFDIILHTPGGAIFFTQSLSKLIRSYGSDVRCFVPYYAMSGGTMLALSCNEIIMGKFACLGPIDPQLGSIWGIGSAKSWQKVVDVKGKKASDGAIQFAFMGEQYTSTLKSNIMEALAGKIQNPDKLLAAADYLTNGSIEHAYQIDAAKLSDLGINSSQIDEEVSEMLSKVITCSWVEGVIYG